jgi:hypothetical protein
MTVVGAGPVLPTDGSGKTLGAFQFSSGPTIYLPAGVTVDPVTGVGAQVTANGELLTAGRTPTAVTASWTSATGVNAAAAIDCTGLSTVTISVRNNGGTFTAGQYSFECSDDGGTTWFSVLATAVAREASGHFGTLTGFGNAPWTMFASQDYVFKIDAGGFTNVRIVLTQAITGTGVSTIRLTASAAASTKPATNAIVGSTGGTAVSTSGIQGDNIDFQFNVGLDVMSFPYLFDPVAGTWSRQRVKVLPTGAAGLPALPVWPNAIQDLTYEASIDNISSGALTANTDKAMFSIEHSGSATKTVKIRRIWLSYSVTTAPAAAHWVGFRLYRGTAASSAGTAVTPLADLPGDAAAEAVVKTLPTITAASRMRSGIMGNAASGVLHTVNMFLLYDWQESGEVKPLTLRAANLDSLMLAVVSNSTPTVLMFAIIIFTEE